MTLNPARQSPALGKVLAPNLLHHRPHHITTNSPPLQHHTNHLHSYSWTQCHSCVPPPRCAHLAPSHLPALSSQPLDRSQPPPSSQQQTTHTKTTTTRPAAGSGVSSRGRNTRRRAGRGFGCGGSLGVWGWGLWLMLLSRILRMLALRRSEFLD
jgi:hypothetical protein